MNVMSILAYILLFTFLGSIAALMGGLALMAKKEFALKVSHFLTPFAAGVLLAAAFFDLLPEALHEGEELGINIFAWALAGIVAFFLLEQTIHWFHHHDNKYHEHEKETPAIIPLIVAGDTIHNFVDGMVIAATFLIDTQLGIVTTFAVAAHEIPQEIGDFALLLHKGLSRMKVVLLNIVSAAAAFVGAIGVYILGDVLHNYVPLFLALTAGFFIYIATSDIIPEIHYEKNRNFAIVKSGLLVLGVVAIYLILASVGHGE